jgi:hypothetical protein
MTSLSQRSQFWIPVNERNLPTLLKTLLLGPCQWAGFTNTPKNLAQVEFMVLHRSLLLGPPSSLLTEVI